MTYYVTTMIRANIRDIKEHFSAFVERVERGATIIVCRRNQPVAELRPLPSRLKTVALGSPVKGLHVPPSFFDPLPAEIERLFYGGGDGD